MPCAIFIWQLMNFLSNSLLFFISELLLTNAHIFSLGLFFIDHEGNLTTPLANHCMALSMFDSLDKFTRLVKKKKREKILLNNNTFILFQKQ